MAKRPTAPPQDNEQEPTAAQAGIEKSLSVELTKGLSCAAQSHTALDGQERLTLLAEAENAYQNALCLVMKAGRLTGSPISKKLRQLRNFLHKNDTRQEEN
jgi:hypothetical protein